MTAEENLEMFRRVMDEGFSEGNLNALDEVMSPDFIENEAGPGEGRGLEGVKDIVRMLRTAFPDLHFTIEEVVAEGDTVAGCVSMSGTHLGPFQGIAATCRSFEQAHMHFVRFRDGKAIEHRAVRDDLGMMRQLGVIAAPADAS